MKTLLLLSLSALSVAAQAVTIDHFTDGTSNSGDVLGSTSSYSSRTAASVPGGFRNVSFTNVTNSINTATTEYQVQVTTGGAINNGLGLSTGPGTMGTLSLSYTISTNANNFPLDLNSTPVVRVDVPFNDMATSFQVTLKSLFGDTFTVTGVAKQATAQDSYVDFDFSSLFAGSNALAGANIVGITLSTTTPTANDFIVRSVDAVAAPVPEPASLAALGLGVVGLLRRRRRG